MFSSVMVLIPGAEPSENWLQGAKLFGRNRFAVAVCLDLVFVATALERSSVSLDVKGDVAVLELTAASRMNVGVAELAGLEGLRDVVTDVEFAGWLGGGSAHLVGWLTAQT